MTCGDNLASNQGNPRRLKERVIVDVARHFETIDLENVWVIKEQVVERDRRLRFHGNELTI